MSHGEPRRIHVERLSIPAGSGWTRLPVIGAIVGLLGIVLSFALGGSSPGQLYHSWLVAFLYFLSFAIGALFFVLLLHATKAGWGIVVRRLGENVMATMPLFLLLFLPIWIGRRHLFVWVDPETVAHDHLLAGKQAWLNPGRFALFAVIYLALWSVLALVFRRGSVNQDRTGDQATSRRMIFWAGPAVIVCALSVSFASFDWGMSLDPHWYSTIFGIYFFAGCLVGIFSLLAILAAGLTRAGYLEGVVTVEHFHDLGKLLYAFCVFWAYIAFSQFFLIWYGNIPEETAFFLHRWEGSWKPLSILLAVGHFCVPFLFLMPRTIKRRPALLVTGAVWMLLMHLLDIYWIVMPNLHHKGVSLSLLDATCLLGVGGMFVAVLGRLLLAHKLVPLRDPRLVESLSFVNF